MPQESTNNSVIVDVQDEINKLNPKILEVLLFDRTSRKNIIWATDDYKHMGNDYSAEKQIFIRLISGQNAHTIRPRLYKAQEQKSDRTKTRAEVFTPVWVCNEQNNLIDAQWFGGTSPFNIPFGTQWEVNNEPIPFASKGARTWKKYVDCKRLEITCGEAPYLVSRYDSVTGKSIPVPERVGLLDRKLRVVCENTCSKEDWAIWARRAVESVYGYEFQGDNLFIARENVFYSYIEYFRYQFQENPPIKDLLKIALIVSWNIWQMDGFTNSIPGGKRSAETKQITMFDMLSDDISHEQTGQKLCNIRDWRSKNSIQFKEIVEGSLK